MNLDGIKITKIQYIILFLLLFLWLYIRAAPPQILSFIQTHYLFNYEHEFLKRGFVGEILRLSVENLNADIVYNLSLFFLFFLSIIFFKIFFIDFNKDTDIHKLIFSTMVFVSPLTIQHFIFEIGRFDIINILITLLCFFIVEKFHKNIFLVAILIFPLLNCMLLIHEGSFFMFIPMIFGFWFLKDSKKNIFGIQLIFFLIITFITYKISTLGLSTIYTYTEYYNFLVNRYFIFADDLASGRFFSIRSTAVEILYRDLFNTYDPNVLYPIFEDTIRIGFNIKWLVNNLILIILLSPVFFIIFTIYRSFFKVSDFKTKLFLITPISPIVLFIFGYDHMRWWALIFTNIFIILFRLCKEKDIYLKIILANIKRYKILYIFLILESFVLGPVKFMSTFDIIESLDFYKKFFL
tara:strand:- start:414 stop:1640 length:1227 start_codon:yes stop_codon:yes gene_type:complete